MSEYLKFKHSLIDLAIEHGKALEGLPGVTVPTALPKSLHEMVDAGTYPDEILFHLLGFLQGLLSAKGRIPDINKSLTTMVASAERLRELRESE